MIILMLAFVVGIACAAYAEVQNVKVSGDLTVYGVMRETAIKNDNQQAIYSVDKSQFLASITRVRIDADLTDNVMTTVRLLNERYWGHEVADSSGADTDTDISLDLALVTMKEFLYSPLTLTIGRQELHFGNDMIVGDPDTNNQVSTASAFTSTDDADLSARKAFDAIRATLNYDPLVVDVVMAKVQENGKKTDDDVTLYGINANYALSKTTTLEGYWFAKHEARKNFELPGGGAATTETGKVRRTDTIGGRVVTKPADKITYQLEAAYQFGKYNDAAVTDDSNRRRAWALETAVAYDFKGRRFNPTAMLSYAYFSGDSSDHVNTANKDYRGWDPMFENQKSGDIANAQFDQTNVHIIGVAGTMKPVEDVTLKGEYFSYWWAKAFKDGTTSTTRRGDPFKMTHKRFAAQEIDLTATYDYTEDVQFGLLTGVLIPGTAFDNDYRNTATEVIGSMKVTF